MTSIKTLLLAAAALAASPAVIHAQGVPANPSPAAVQAGTYGVEPAHTRINFTVSHMGFTQWYGDFTDASGSLTIDPKAPAAAKVDISIPTASVLTINTKLNEELRSDQWFDAAKYPTIRFVSTKVTPTGPRTALITGDLTFHGVTKPVVLHASYNAGGVNPLDKATTIGFDATAQIKRSDFGVTTYVPLIGDDVALRISAAFELKK